VPRRVPGLTEIDALSVLILNLPEAVQQHPRVAPERQFPCEHLVQPIVIVISHASRLANPKSVSRGTFDGLTSRCTTPWLWAYSRVAASVAMRRAASRGGGRLAVSQSFLRRAAEFLQAPAALLPRGGIQSAHASVLVQLQTGDPLGQRTIRSGSPSIGLGTRHSRAVLSALPVSTVLPSGLKATLSTGP
jgi:hypothetical protein